MIPRRAVLERDGQEVTGRLFGSLMEEDGRFKVFAYVIH